MIDGNAFAAELKSRLLEEVALLSTTSVRPGLATVIAGDDYAAQAYERRVRHLAHDLGCNYVCERLGSNVEQADALAVVGKLNADPRISGILILRPLVASVSEAEIYRALDPLKDIEAVHPLNAGLLALGRPRYIPSTPASCFYLLDRYRATQVAIHGRSIGESPLCWWDDPTTSASRLCGSGWLATPQ